MATKVLCGRCGKGVVAGAPMKAHRKSVQCITHGLTYYGQQKPPKFFPQRRVMYSREGVPKAVSWYVSPLAQFVHDVMWAVKAFLTRPPIDDGEWCKENYPSLRAISEPKARKQDAWASWSWEPDRFLRIAYRRAKRDPEWLAALESVKALGKQKDLVEFLEQTLWGNVR